MISPLDRRLPVADDPLLLRQQLAALSERLDRMLAALRQPGPDRFLVRTGSRCQVLRVADVEWFEAADNYLRAHTRAGVRTLRYTLRQLGAELDPAGWMRVHRSALVRLDAVEELATTPSGETVLHLRSGARVPVSRQLRDLVRRRLGREG